MGGSQSSGLHDNLTEAEYDVWDQMCYEERCRRSSDWMRSASYSFNLFMQNNKDKVKPSKKQNRPGRSFRP